MKPMPLPNKAIIDGVPRFIAYTAAGGRVRHYECGACSEHFNIDKPYYYTDDNGDSDVPLCDDCVRGPNADPRFIWWADVPPERPTVKYCTDEQLDAAISNHLNSRRCGRCNQPLGALLVSQGKPIHYDCN